MLIGEPDSAELSEKGCLISDIFPIAATQQDKDEMQIESRCAH